MAKGRGISKGSPYERDMARFFSLWWSNQERDDIYWRTDGSGGRATSRRKTQKKTAYQEGDMTFEDPIGKPLIDLALFEFKKGYPDISILNILNSKKKKHLLLEFFDKAEQERIDAKRYFTFLIFRQDHKKDVLATELALISQLEGWYGDYGETIITIERTGDKPIIALVEFDKFMNYFTPDSINHLFKSNEYLYG